MNQNDLRTAQNIMLDILKAIHRVCEENDIKYYLFAGSLIGAVRHNGFIPWDDDIDIGMLRPDYNKFCKVAQKSLGNDFFLQNTKTDKGYALFFSKVMKNNTRWIEGGTVSAEQQHHGIYVDVMPFDKVPADEKSFGNFWNYYRIINYFTFVKYKYYKHDKSDKHTLIKLLLIKLLPKSFLVSYRNHLAQKYSKCNKSYLITGLWDEVYKKLQPEHIYDEVFLHKFEDSEFYIPKSYDTVLKKIYGNYMELPPLEKRVTHEILEYDFYSAGDI